MKQPKIDPRERFATLKRLAFENRPTPSNNPAAIAYFLMQIRQGSESIVCMSRRSLAGKWFEPLETVPAEIVRGLPDIELLEGFANRWYLTTENFRKLKLSDKITELAEKIEPYQTGLNSAMREFHDSSSLVTSAEVALRACKEREVAARKAAEKASESFENAIEAAAQLLAGEVEF